MVSKRIRSLFRKKKIRNKVATDKSVELLSMEDQLDLLNGQRKYWTLRIQNHPSISKMGDIDSDEKSTLFNGVQERPVRPKTWDELDFRRLNTIKRLEAAGFVRRPEPSVWKSISGLRDSIELQIPRRPTGPEVVADIATEAKQSRTRSRFVSRLSLPLNAIYEEHGSEDLDEFYGVYSRFHTLHNVDDTESVYELDIPSDPPLPIISASSIHIESSSTGSDELEEVHPISRRRTKRYGQIYCLPFLALENGTFELKPTRTCLNIPEEILLLIFAHLNLSDLWGSCKQVSKGWRQMSQLTALSSGYVNRFNKQHLTEITMDGLKWDRNRTRQTWTGMYHNIFCDTDCVSILGSIATIRVQPSYKQRDIRLRTSIGTTHCEETKEDAFRPTCLMSFEFLPPLAVRVDERIVFESITVSTDYAWIYDQMLDSDRMLEGAGVVYL